LLVDDGETHSKGMTYRDFYTSGKYVEQNPYSSFPMQYWKANQLIALLKENGLEELKTLVEVGCGSGAMLRYCAEKMPHVRTFKGFDISPYAIEHAKQFEAADSRLSYECLDAVTQDIERAELLCCMDIFEHVEDYFTFLRNLKLKAEYKVFHIPLDLSVQMVLRGRPLLHVREKVGHIHYFTKELALATLKDCGYELVDFRYTPSGLQLGSMSGFQKLLLPFRKLLFPFFPDFTVRLLGGYSLLVLTR
jgi:SAM-dependent methyltransferase